MHAREAFSKQAASFLLSNNVSSVAVKHHHSYLNIKIFLRILVYLLYFIRHELRIEKQITNTTGFIAFVLSVM